MANRLVGTCDSIVVAYGWNFADGLCGGLLAATTDSAILLALDAQHEDAAAYADKGDIQSGYVLGGIGCFKDHAVFDIFNIDTFTEKYSDGVNLIEKEVTRQ